MALLSNLSSTFPPSLFADMLDMAGRERFPEGTAAMIEFCRQFHQSHCNHPFSLLSKKWIQSGSFERKYYAQAIKWAAYEENEADLYFLSRMSPPPDLSPSERKAAMDIWKTKPRRKSPPWRQAGLSDTTRVSIQNQLYLLSDNHEEKLQILQEVLPLLRLPFLDRSLLSVWATRLTKHCQEYPADERRLREYFLDLIHHSKPAPDGDNQPAVNWHPECQKKYLAGWFGIVHLGAGESEFRLLDSVRTQSGQPMPNFMNEQLKWELLSRWQPVSPTVQAELLDWWQSSPVTTAPCALQPRWKAIFSLEKDESRLVQLIEELPDNVFPQEIPDGWFPHSPQLRERLVKAVPERLDAFIAQINQGIRPPKSLWQLLFRLPVSGSRILDFIHRSVSAVNAETDFPSHIADFLQSPGLPPDTSKEDIRQTVETIVRHQKLRRNQFNSFGINVFRVAVELLREYVRCGTSGPAAGDGPSIDPAWIHSTLEVLADNTVEVDQAVVNISENWKETSPPHAQFLIHSLWLAGIRCLATCLSASPSQYQREYKIGSLLGALHRLTREVYPPGNPGINLAGAMNDHSVSSATHPFPPQLWETLSTAVTQTRNEKNFLLAASLGNHLARYANPGQRQRWAMDLRNNRLHHAPDVPDVLYRNFLLNNLVSELEHFREESPGEQRADTTELLRFLRQRMHLFPDAPAPGCGFWTEIWEETFKAWSMEVSVQTPAKIRNTLSELKMAEFIEKPFPPPRPASTGQASSADWRPASPGQSRS